LASNRGHALRNLDAVDSSWTRSNSLHLFHQIAVFVPQAFLRKGRSDGLMNGEWIIFNHQIQHKYAIFIIDHTAVAG
jgi:hypothetical protein